MPLSEPAPRQLKHQRQIQCRGYERADGLWDIEGHLVDTKTFGFHTRARGDVPAGEPVHEMWIRLTVDTELHVHAAESCTDFSPFPVCGRVNADFHKLEGLQVGPGWMREVGARIGGVRGCTHLVELLRTIATTAYQTVVGKRRPEVVDPARPPRHINGCHALASDGEVVKLEWPEYYTGR